MNENEIQIASGLADMMDGYGCVIIAKVEYK